MDKAVRARNDNFILTVEVQLGLRFSVSSCKVTISIFLALVSTGIFLLHTSLVGGLDTC